jgi:hypothetical protein
VKVGATCTVDHARKLHETCRKHEPAEPSDMLDAVRMTQRPAARGEALTDRAARVELEGELPVGWLGNLASGLARRGVSIVRGSAERQGKGWRAAFEVVSDESQPTHPKDLDFVSFALEDGTDGSDPVTLESFVLNVPRRSTAIELTVRGRDRRGFLAALLERLALLGLFPERISVETVHGSAADTFWLHSLGGSAPTARSIDALRQFLRGVTSSPSSPGLPTAG